MDEVKLKGQIESEQKDYVLEVRSINYISSVRISYLTLPTVLGCLSKPAYTKEST
jgi:hypothetical protein